jgi:hypothetical protein
MRLDHKFWILIVGVVLIDLASVRLLFPDVIQWPNPFVSFLAGVTLAEIIR